MHLYSVNIGQAQAIQIGNKTGLTGIYKRPVQGPVEVGPLGLPGDAIIAAAHHGGPDQAVYIYTVEDYAFWAGELHTELLPGTFGENLTLAGLESAACAVGDFLQVGPVLLQVTSPRIPCSTLAARMGDPHFVKRFRAAERPGLYCRVLTPGPLQAGDPASRQPFGGETITILESFRDYYNPGLDEPTLRRHLAAPISIRERAALEKQLAKLLQTP